jgi:toxin ParE1/3/4
MLYRVDLTERAVRDLAHLYEIKNASESVAAARWYNGLEKAVYTLETYPRRCPLAPESGKAGRALRHLLYGKTPHVYRVIYEINEPKRLVQVLSIRHGARRSGTLRHGNLPPAT